MRANLYRQCQLHVTGGVALLGTSCDCWEPRHRRAAAFGLSYRGVLDATTGLIACLWLMAHRALLAPHPDVFLSLTWRESVVYVSGPGLSLTSHLGQHTITTDHGALTHTPRNGPVRTLRLAGKRRHTNETCRTCQ